MLATTLIRLFLRVMSLWIGITALERGILTFVFQDIHIASAQLAIIVATVFVLFSIAAWCLSAKLSRFIVGKDEQATCVSWSSQSVVLTGIVFFGLYTLFVDSIPALLDYITRSALLLSSEQYAYLVNPSILVPGIIAIIKIVVAILITMNARPISNVILKKEPT